MKLFNSRKKSELQFLIWKNPIVIVAFPESSAAAHTWPQDAEDNESELTTLDTSDDEMQTDCDSLTDGGGAEQPREPMRSDVFSW